jgi:starch phosphorylase
MRRVKQSLMNLSPRFNCNRMVREYATQLYTPAAEAFRQASRDHFKPARELSVWLQRVREVWERVRFIEVGPVLSNPSLSGQAIPLHAVIDLAGLQPSDVRVEAVIGPISIEGHLRETTVLTMPATGDRDGFHVFSQGFIPDQTGRLGYAVRVSPNHCDDPLTRPCYTYLKWAR